MDFEFVGRHLLDPVDSTNQEYIRSKILEQIRGTSVTVVLLGNGTHSSEWVRDEIQMSQNKENPNGIVAIRLKDQNAPLPGDSPVGTALREAGAEIVDWNPDGFGAAIERAAIAAGRVIAMRQTALNPSTETCGR